jgi:hypothetical protein
MTDIELQNIINKLREYTLKKRQSALSRHAVFFLAVIDMVCCLTELGLYEPRPITQEEEHWFEGGYHMNFWDAEIQENLYTPLVYEVRQRNFFRQ